jgi:hypothetical protein
MSVSYPCNFQSSSVLMECKVILVDGNNHTLEGLGNSNFGRIPCVGEHVLLNAEDKDKMLTEKQTLFQVSKVIHCQSYGHYAAEIRVEKLSEIDADNILGR